MSITVGSRVRVTKHLSDWTVKHLIGRTGTLEINDGTNLPYQITFDNGTDDDNNQWFYPSEVEPVGPDHLAIKELGDVTFSVGGYTYYYDEDPDQLQSRAERDIAAAAHIRAHKPKVIEEPTETGARLEVDGTFDNEGKRVMVHRLPGIGAVNQPWVEFGTYRDGQTYSVWTWDLLKTRNPKVVQ